MLQKIYTYLCCKWNSDKITNIMAINIVKYWFLIERIGTICEITTVVWKECNLMLDSLNQHI